VVQSRLLRVLTLAAAALVMCTSPAVVRADVVVLDDGFRYIGTVQDREDVRAHPDQHTSIGIRVPGAMDFFQVPASIIASVVLEDSGGNFVITFRSAAPPAAVSRPAAMPQTRVSRGDNAVPLVVGGGLIAGLGAVARFGGAKATATEDSFDYSEHSYNWLNYALMIGGGVMVVAGVAQLSTRPSVAAAPGGGPALVLDTDGSKVGLYATFSSQLAN
jgi:hypothetical protein